MDGAWGLVCDGCSVLCDRFKYSGAFLQWALQVPGFVRDWHLGVRIGSSGR